MTFQQICKDVHMVKTSGQQVFIESRNRPPPRKHTATGTRIHTYKIIYSGIYFPEAIYLHCVSYSRTVYFSLNSFIASCSGHCAGCGPALKGSSPVSAGKEGPAQCVLLPANQLPR